MRSERVACKFSLKTSCLSIVKLIKDRRSLIKSHYFRFKRPFQSIDRRRRSRLESHFGPRAQTHTTSSTYHTCCISFRRMWNCPRPIPKNTISPSPFHSLRGPPVCDPVNVSGLRFLVGPVPSANSQYTTRIPPHAELPISISSALPL